jgi:hypothetical protein
VLVVPADLCTGIAGVDRTSASVLHIAAGNRQHGAVRGRWLAGDAEVLMLAGMFARQAPVLVVPAGLCMAPSRCGSNVCVSPAYGEDAEAQCRAGDAVQGLQSVDVSGKNVREPWCS